jgi:hypothetical protein
MPFKNQVEDLVATDTDLFLLPMILDIESQKIWRFRKQLFFSNPLFYNSN